MRYPLHAHSKELASAGEARERERELVSVPSVPLAKSVADGLLRPRRLRVEMRRRTMETWRVSDPTYRNRCSLKRPTESQARCE